jgi:hypothetical protein
MDITGRQNVSQVLARTYGGDRDGWERVTEYQRVLEYTGKHPDKGSSAVASAVGLPRGRIRPWIDDGARPDPVFPLVVPCQPQPTRGAWPMLLS